MKENSNIFIPETVAELRIKVEEQTRFKKKMQGYDPKSVDEYIKAQSMALQSEKAAWKVREQEILDLLSAAQAAIQERSEQLSDLRERCEQETLKAERCAEELNVAQEREHHYLVTQAKSESIIEQLRSSSDPQKLEEVKNQLNKCMHERNEYFTQLTITRKETEKLSERLKTALEEKSAIQKAFSQEQQQARAHFGEISMSTIEARVLSEQHRNNVSRQLEELANSLRIHCTESEQIFSQIQQQIQIDQVV